MARLKRVVIELVAPISRETGNALLADKEAFTPKTGVIFLFIDDTL